MFCAQLETARWRPVFVVRSILGLGETCIIDTSGVGSGSPRDQHETNEKAEDFTLNTLMLAHLNCIGDTGVVRSNTIADRVVVVIGCFALCPTEYQCKRDAKIGGTDVSSGGVQRRSHKHHH
jgi:hypothetical protein